MNTKLARAQALQTTEAADDRNFTVEEVKKTVESMNNKKAPGGRRHYGRYILLCRQHFTEIHNSHLQWLLEEWTLPDKIEES
jgi:hypothetical protein